MQLNCGYIMVYVYTLGIVVHTQWTAWSVAYETV